MIVRRAIRQALEGLLIQTVFLSAGWGQTTYYVATNGNNEADGLSWATAVKSVEMGVQKATNAGDTVLIGDGLFSVTSLWIEVTNGITITSLNGPTNTILDAGDVNGRRVMYVNHPDAFVAGLTLRRGQMSQWVAGPGGLRVDAGVVSNCIVTLNRALQTGGGVRITGGLLTHSLVHNNQAHSTLGTGGGIYVSGGEVAHCVVSNNDAYVSGSGIYMTGGRVRDTLVIANKHETIYSTEGCGVYLSGGTLERCIIQNNKGRYTRRGGGIYATGAGRIVNCLVIGNWCEGEGGGLYIAASTAQVYHVTIAGNYSKRGGRGLYQLGGAVSNSIIVANGSVLRARNENLVALGGTRGNLCSDHPVSGTAIVVRDPLFQDAQAGDYRLKPGSPCRDAGVSIPTVGNDLLGQPRPNDGDGNGFAAPDLGAYEASALNVLACRFEAEPWEGLGNATVTLTAEAAGPDTNIIWYGWDVTGDGQWDYAGADQQTIQHEFGVGFHRVTLAVSNASLESATSDLADAVRVVALTSYVARSGTNREEPPYDTLDKAASNIQSAVDTAWSFPGYQPVVLVTNGVYPLIQTVTLITNVTVLSLAGPAVTIVDASSISFGIRRAFLVNHPAAVLAGFTGRNGAITDWANGGGGLWLGSGLVSNCWFGGNQTYVYGSGAYVQGGVLSDCRLTNNTCNSSGGSAGGLYLAGGVVERCLIARNSSLAGATGMVMTNGLFSHGIIVSNAPTSTKSRGGGVLMSDGILRNSLLAWNGNLNVTNGGGAALIGGHIESCTIVSNRAASTGGGLAVYGGTVTNTLLAFNHASNEVNVAGSLSSVGYSCAPELPGGVNGNLDAEARFQNAANGDFRLAPASPGVNAGIYQPWMAGAVDLSGEPRLCGRVDMGAFESPFVAGTILIIR